MAKIKNIVSAIQTHSRSLLIIVFICSIGAAAIYSERRGVDWGRQIAALQDWLFLDPPKKSAGTAAPSDPQPSSNGEPAFDVAFADPDGKLVTAGRGAPGWTIRISSNGAILGETKASLRGEWVFEPNEPLAAGNYALSLLAIEPHSQRTVSGPKSIALSIMPRPLAPAQPTRPHAIAGAPSAEIK